MVFLGHVLGSESMMSCMQSMRCKIVALYMNDNLCDLDESTYMM